MVPESPIPATPPATRAAIKIEIKTLSFSKQSALMTITDNTTGLNNNIRKPPVYN